MSAPGHTIVADAEPVGRGWSARCECERRFPVRRDPDAARRDAAEHLAATIVTRLAGRHNPHRQPLAFVRSVLDDGELAAVARLNRQAS